MESERLLTACKHPKIPAGPAADLGHRWLAAPVTHPSIWRAGRPASIWHSVLARFPTSPWGSPGSDVSPARYRQRQFRFAVGKCAGKAVSGLSGHRASRGLPICPAVRPGAELIPKRGAATVVRSSWRSTVRNDLVTIHGV